MANVQEIAILQAAIMTLLNLPAAGQLLNLNSNTCERAYEAYVFSLCCKAVRRAGELFS
jgi:hypothetical protein